MHMIYYCYMIYNIFYPLYYFEKNWTLAFLLVFVEKGRIPHQETGNTLSELVILQDK